MTEQERPRTEAGRTFLRVLARETWATEPRKQYATEKILAIEAEGRQQAVREIRDVADALRWYVEKDAGHNCANDGPTWRQRCKVAAARRAVAGLNASESPPVEDIAGDLWHQREGWHSMGDASESGQPPEASR